MTGPLPELVVESRFPAPVQDPWPVRLGFAASLLLHVGLLAAFSFGELGADPIPEPEETPPLLVDLIVDVPPEEAEDTDILAALNPGKIAEALPPSTPEVAQAVAPDALAPATSAERAEAFAPPAAEAVVPAAEPLAPVESNVPAAEAGDPASAVEAVDDRSELTEIDAEAEAAEAADAAELLELAEPPAEELASANEVAAAQETAGDRIELPPITADEPPLPTGPEELLAAAEPEPDALAASDEIAVAQVAAGDATELPAGAADDAAPPAAPEAPVVAAEPAAETLAVSDEIAAATAAAGERAELTPATTNDLALPAAAEAPLAAIEPQAETLASSDRIATAETSSAESAELAAAPPEQPALQAPAADPDEVVVADAAPVAASLASPPTLGPVSPEPAPPQLPQLATAAAAVPDVVAIPEPQPLEHASGPPPNVAAPAPAAPSPSAAASEATRVEIVPDTAYAVSAPEMRTEDVPVDRATPSLAAESLVPTAADEAAPAAEANVGPDLREAAADALAVETGEEGAEDPPPLLPPAEIARPAAAAPTLPDAAQNAEPASALPGAPVAAAAVPIPPGPAAANAAEPQRPQQAAAIAPSAPAAPPAAVPAAAVAPAAAAAEAAKDLAVAEVPRIPNAAAALGPAPAAAAEVGAPAPPSLAALSSSAPAVPVAERPPTQIGGRPAPVPEAIPVTGERTEVAAIPVAPRLATGVDPDSEIEAVVRSYGCARVSALYEINGGAVTLSGHLKTPADRDDLLEKLAGVPGISRVEASDLHIIGDPYCRVLSFLARPEFVRSDEQRADISAIGDPVQASVDRFEAGTLLELQMIAPDFPSYIYVDYFAVDGNVYHLLPTTSPEEGRFDPDEQFGLGGRYERGLKVTIAPPFGLDLILAVGSSERLFDAVRPTAESAEDYLAALGAAIEEAEAEHPDLRLEYAYHLIYTGPAAGQ